MNFRSLVVGTALTLTVISCGTTTPFAEQAGSANESGAGAGLVVPSPSGGAGPGGVADSQGGGQLGGTGGTSPGQLTTTRTPSTRRVTAPLTVGVLSLTTNSAIDAIGASRGQPTLTAERAAKALAQRYNGRGGIAGRQIRIVAHTLDVSDPSYQIGLDAACATFTQDNRADVVLSKQALFSENYETCLARAGVANIEFFAGGPPDEESYARYPSMVTVSIASVNRHITAVLTGLTNQGVLTPQNKVGVVVEGCPYNRRAYDTTFQPLARRLGLTVLRHDIDCMQGFSDVGRYESQVSQAVLRFQTEDVDRVTFICTFEGLAMLAFSQQAETQRYSPWYMLDSSAGVANTAGENFARNALPRIVGVGELPDNDVTSLAPSSPTTTRCRSIFAAQGLTAANKADALVLDEMCAAFFLLEAGLLRSNGHAASSALLPAIQALGASHLSPLTLNAATIYDRQHRDGVALFSVFAYKESCSCFVYTTKPARFA